MERLRHEQDGEFFEHFLKVDLMFEATVGSAAVLDSPHRSRAARKFKCGIGSETVLAASGGPRSPLHKAGGGGSGGGDDGDHNDHGRSASGGIAMATSRRYHRHVATAAAASSSTARQHLHHRHSGHAFTLADLKTSPSSSPRRYGVHGDLGIGIGGGGVGVGGGSSANDDDDNNDEDSLSAAGNATEQEEEETTDLLRKQAATIRALREEHFALHKKTVSLEGKLAEAQEDTLLSATTSFVPTRQYVFVVVVVVVVVGGGGVGWLVSSAGPP